MSELTMIEERQLEFARAVYYSPELLRRRQVLGLGFSVFAPLILMADIPDDFLVVGLVCLMIGGFGASWWDLMHSLWRAALHAKASRDADRATDAKSEQSAGSVRR